MSNLNLMPLNDSVFFEFLDDVSVGRFTNRNQGAIILTNKNDSDQSNLPRWGKVLKVGRDVGSIEINEYILIEPLQWSFPVVWEGQKFWSTKESNVLAVTIDINDTF